MWRNWAGDQQCVPARMERPRTIDELRRVVSSAAGAGMFTADFLVTVSIAIVGLLLASRVRPPAM